MKTPPLSPAPPPGVPVRAAMSDYATFLARKSQLGGDSGFDPIWMPDFLFDFQQHLVEWALRKGRAAIFADCGLGKTLIELVWADNVVRQTGGRVLILTPLAVRLQFVAEAARFGLECQLYPHPSAKIVVANYQRLHQLDTADYVGIVCDESSILKHYSGHTQKAVTRFLCKAPYRLLASATPAPNDYTELGTASEALGELTYSDMLETFFKELDWDERRQLMFEGHYSRRLSLRAIESMTRWRFKGHAKEPFWRWVASWGRALRRPSDLDATYDDARFCLPPLQEHSHMIASTRAAAGMLFPLPAMSLRQEIAERRAMLPERCEKVAELVSHQAPALVWCHLNCESDLLRRLIPDAVEVSGQDEEEAKEERIAAFLRQDAQARVLITKPKIAGLGLNLQHCAHVVTFATHSFESYYQSVRRCWRFGQTQPVLVDLIATEGEARLHQRLRDKCARSDELYNQIVAWMRESLSMTASAPSSSVSVPEWLHATR
jgi:superfamily II DNA or RNA helicase